MTARILSGKEFAARIKADAKAEAEKLREETGVMPGLAGVIVGEDPASQVYVRNKHKACEELGSSKVLNVVLLGAAVRTGKLGLSEEDIKEAMKETVKEKFLPLNYQALEYAG